MCHGVQQKYMKWLRFYDISMKLKSWCFGMLAFPIQVHKHELLPDFPSPSHMHTYWWIQGLLSVWILNTALCKVIDFCIPKYHLIAFSSRVFTDGFLWHIISISNIVCGTSSELSTLVHEGVVNYHAWWVLLCNVVNDSL